MKTQMRRLFFKYCPSFILQKIIRNMIQISYDYDPKLVIKIAETKEELEGAFQVLYRSYLEMGYCDKSESEMRLTVYHALPTSSVIIAKYDNKVVGTLTLVRNNNLKLPCEKIWDIGFLKKNDRRVAEITSLAIDKEFRRVKNGNIFFPVLKFMYQFATECFGTEILSIIIHPKERDFYEGLFYFTPIDNKVVDNYYGAPAIALYLDLVAAKSRYEQVYGDKPAAKNIFHYFTQFNSRNLVMPVKKSYSVDFPVLDKELFQYFFFEKSDVGESISDQDLRKILAHYPSRENIRSKTRFTVDIPARIVDPKTLESRMVVIKNISASGLRIVAAGDSAQSIEFIKPYRDFRIQFMHQGRPLEIVALNQWMNHETQAGFTVHANQLHWYRFLKSIHSTYAFSEELSEVFHHRQAELAS